MLFGELLWVFFDMTTLVDDSLHDGAHVASQLKLNNPFRDPFAKGMLITIASSAIYGIAFVPLYGAWGAGAAALGALPVASTGWALGLRGGVIAGFIAFPLNVLLLNLVGETGWDVVIRNGGGPGSAVIVIIGGVIGLLRDFKEQLRAQLDERNRLLAEREELVSGLQRALSEVKTLSGLLPICASCKSIRDDEGYWDSIEKYLVDNSDAELTHGICPSCAKSLYPGILDKPA